MDILKDGRFRLHGKLFPCQNPSCLALYCSDSSHICNFVHDPIGEHIVKLRKYLIDVDDLMWQYKQLQCFKGPLEAKVKKVYELENEPLPKVPPFPKDYPYQHTLKYSRNKIGLQLKSRVVVHQNAVNYMTAEFVQCVAFYSGYASAKEDTIKELVKATDRFLRHFMTTISQTLNMLDTQDELDVLDYSLQRIGFGGIKGLHTYYYENIVKKHDLLYNACETKLKELKKLKREEFNRITAESDQ